jgi:nicotinamide-nucleotide amidase
MKNNSSDIYKLSEKVICEMINKRLTLGIAESLTGGGLAYYLTSVPGSSKVLKGGIIAYGTPIKIGLLGVNSETIENCGVVSMEVAIEMAIGIRIRTASNIGIGVTGYAGPEGGDDFAPIGRVYWGVAIPSGYSNLELNLKGERNEIREEAIKRGLEFLLDKL